MQPAAMAPLLNFAKMHGLTRKSMAFVYAVEVPRKRRGNSRSDATTCLLLLLWFRLVFQVDAGDVQHVIGFIVLHSNANEFAFSDG